MRLEAAAHAFQRQGRARDATLTDDVPEHDLSRGKNAALPPKG
jgi:hypothetical protein